MNVDLRSYKHFIDKILLSNQGPSKGQSHYSDLYYTKKNNKHENIRVQFFDKVIDLCQNFRYMDTSSKFVWLFTNEHEQVLKKLGSFIEECFLL